MAQMRLTTLKVFKALGSFFSPTLAQKSSFPNGGFLSGADDCHKKSAIWSSASALKADKCDKTFLSGSHPTVGSYQAVKPCCRVKCHKIFSTGIQAARNIQRRGEEVSH